MVSRRQFLLVSAGTAVGALAGCADDLQPATSAPSTVLPPTPTASASPSATPAPTPDTGTPPAPSGPPRPRLAGTVADNLDVPWGIVFLASGDSLAGKILRIRPDGRAAPGNPFGNRT
jgi:glucose/arabinose dehydrogenase